MRLITLSRTKLGTRHVRLDPGFYVGQEHVRLAVEAESSRRVRLVDLVESIHDGARLPAAAAGIPMLRLNNVRSCELDLSNLTQVDGAAAKWVNVHAGDVLFTRAAQPFRAAAVQSGQPAELAVSSELIVIRPRAAVLPEYLAVVLCTPTLSGILRDLAYRGLPSSLPRLRLPDIQHLPIPLPPRSLQASFGSRYQQAAELTAEARAEINSVASAIHSEIDHRVSGRPIPTRSTIEVRRSTLPNRWDVSFNRGCALRDALTASSIMRPLLEFAKSRESSVQGLSDHDEVFVIQADDVNGATFLVEGGEHRSLGGLSSRMRQRLQVADVLICTTGAGDQVAFLDDGVEFGGHPILGSATFTALRFSETPRVFAVTLSHSLVRRQLQMLSSGSVQRFVNKRDLNELLVPVLGQVWREDFEVRLTRAMQRRREALISRAALIDAVDHYVREAMR